jgi:2-dehydro-3-deoxygalactonokinase
MIAIDWGTTSLRAALLDAHGHVLDVRASPQGILNVPPGQFAAVFDSTCADWMKAESGVCLISGMCGSRQGWLEAPYCPCPANSADLAEALAWVEPQRIAIVPGLSFTHDSVPDVMRGEEVQVLGTLDLLGLQDATLVLPGTHSKWVSVRAARIQGFSTFMTGEVYGLLRQHSILARMLPADEPELDTAAFDRGVRHAMSSSSLLATAFSTRTLALFEQLNGPELVSYLSGLVIGEELRAQPPGTVADGVVVIGSPALTERYARAFSVCGKRIQTIGPEATWRGLWRIAQTIH